MDLVDQSQVARTAKIGRQNVEVFAGQSLKIETAPGGVEVLDSEVPAGKKWTVYIYVEIVETDIE